MEGSLSWRGMPTEQVSCIVWWRGVPPQQLGMSQVWGCFSHCPYPAAYSAGSPEILSVALSVLEHMDLIHMSMTKNQSLAANF